MAPTTPQAAVFQAWFSSNPRARARLAMSQAPTKQPIAMPTPCGENCTGPMPILGMTFQPIMDSGSILIFHPAPWRGASGFQIGALRAPWDDRIGEPVHDSRDIHPSQSGGGYNALGKVGPRL